MKEVLANIRKAFINRRANRQTPWWDGRNVARRPGVPTHLDINALQLIRTPEERRIFTARIGASLEETMRRIRQGDRSVADWLLQGDDLSKSQEK